jgi:phosphonate transport system substrate-binding protein
MANAEPGQLIFGVHPYLPKEEIQQRFTPLIDYLSRQLGIPVALQVPKDYEVHIENVGNQVVDFAYMGPASYVELTQKYGKHPLLARLEINGKPFFHGYIVSANEQLVDNIALLKGKRFAFGSLHSTMSYLVPRHMLKEAGVSLDALGGYQFMGNHRNVALGVLLGEFDAGAVKEEVYAQFRKQGLHKVAISAPISEHVFIAKKKLADDKVEALRQAMYKLAQTDAGLKILGKIKKNITALVPVHDSDYDNLRIIMK